MAKILLISEDISTQTVVQTTLLDHEFIVSVDETTILDIMKVELPDIVMIDSELKTDIKPIFRKIKDFQVIFLLLLGETPMPQEVMSSAHLFTALPVNVVALKSTIESGLRVRKSLQKLSKSNKELANSLYQLNVLYNTSSKLSGSLSRNSLVDVMNEGIDKSLSSDISCTLSFKDDRTPVLLIDSNYKLSGRLVEALRLRAVLNYKNSGMDVTELFSIDDIEVEQNIKHSINEYDFEILNYHKLISYITLDGKCQGYSEVFREKDFSSDDEKCFQTLVNQATQPLKNAILYQEIAQKNEELARLERLKSEFISIASHELKTPLTSVKNSLDIISSGKTGEITDSMKKFLDMAKRNVNALSKIVTSLLDRTKIEAGKMNYKFVKTSIEPVINVVVQSLSQIALKRDLSLSVRTDTNLKDVNIDTDRIEQVLNNLVSNAIKYTQEKGVINISAKMVSAEDIVTDECFKPQIEKLQGEYLQVCVSDQGIGIDKNDYMRIFDMFEQIENSLSREVGGTGLGLSIAKEIIFDHKGAIWCDSVLNKGTVFSFVLPVADKKGEGVI